MHWRLRADCGSVEAGWPWSHGHRIGVAGAAGRDGHLLTLRALRVLHFTFESTVNSRLLTQGYNQLNQRE